MKFARAAEFLVEVTVGSWALLPDDDQWSLFLEGPKKWCDLSAVTGQLDWQLINKTARTKPGLRSPVSVIIAALTEHLVFVQHRPSLQYLVDPQHTCEVGVRTQAVDGEAEAGEMTGLPAPEFNRSASWLSLCCAAPRVLLHRITFPQVRSVFLSYWWEQRKTAFP